MHALEGEPLGPVGLERFVVTRSVRVSGSGSRPSSARSSSTGVPAAHACGRADVGTTAGGSSSRRSNPANSSGSRWSKNGAVSSERAHRALDLG